MCGWYASAALSTIYASAQWAGGIFVSVRLSVRDDFSPAITNERLEG